MSARGRGRAPKTGARRRASPGRRAAHRHVLVALPVAADDVVALLLESLREVARDEAARPGDADAQLRRRPVRLGACREPRRTASASRDRPGWEARTIDGVNCKPGGSHCDIGCCCCFFCYSFSTANARW